MKNPMPAHVIVVQPALPAYRLDFFERVARQFGDRFHVYYSPTDMGAITDGSSTRPWAKKIGLLKNLAPGIEWQQGVLGIAIRQGDVVVVSGGPRCITNIVLLIKARLSGAKTIWWGHLWSATTKAHRFYIRLMLMRLSHALLFYTDEEVATYKSRVRPSDRRLVMALNNGINIDEVAKYRKPYESASRSNSILFIGRLTDKANVSLLFRALALMASNDVTLDMIGDGPEREGLESLARDLQITHRIRWHNGTTDEAAIARIANNCAIFVYPGSVGLSLMHAMAYGLPAIVHDDRTAHMPEIAAFTDGGTGLSFLKDSPSDLAGKIIQILGGHVWRSDMSKRAIDCMERSFNTRDMATRLFKLALELNGTHE